ncbi:MAG TPA: Flp family type IVb pilin [Rhizomicrobium sp.]|nr:Flp family type IVb pilin [Rhizomicrobium sp.]
MGASARFDGLRDAAGRSAAYSDAARSALMAFARDTGGATAIEYAMIAGLVSVFIYTAMALVGQNLQNAFYNGLQNMFNS